MSTSAVIKVEGFNLAAVYKHWDGYPEATLPWLESFNNVFTKRRGEDPEYKFAQLLRSSVSMAKEFHLDPSTETGWGVVGMDTVDAEYTYTLHTDGRVTFSAA